MASELLKPSPGFSRRLRNVVAIIDRFHVEAERKGDMAFAEALRSCALMISGGNMLCPLGHLVVEETLRTGQFPLSQLTPEAPRPAPPIQPAHLPPQPSNTVHPTLKAIEWQKTFSRLWTILEEDAKRTGDKNLLAALQECEELTDSHKCPVRDLIARYLNQT